MTLYDDGQLRGRAFGPAADGRVWVLRADRPPWHPDDCTASCCWATGDPNRNRAAGPLPAPVAAGPLGASYLAGAVDDYVVRLTLTGGVVHDCTLDQARQLDRELHQAIEYAQRAARRDRRCYR